MTFPKPSIISRIVDRVQPRLVESQSRELCECYPFLYVDALVVPVKTVNKAVYSIIGINTEGIKDCLGFWISDKEGTHFWLSIFDELKTRGVKKLGFVNIDGLTGLEEGIKSIYPGAVSLGGLYPKVEYVSKCGQSVDEQLSICRTTI